jgi:hypothetical protein
VSDALAVGVPVDAGADPAGEAPVVVVGAKPGSAGGVNPGVAVACACAGFGESIDAALCRN